jgi:DNA-binding TFAR19-related protein (PDSD5 family)
MIWLRFFCSVLQKAQYEDQRIMILDQILEPAAKER